MHLAEGVLPAEWAAVWFAPTAAATAIGVRKPRSNTTHVPQRKALTGTVGALVFHHDPLRTGAETWKRTWLSEADPRVKIAFLTAAVLLNLLSQSLTTGAAAIGVSLVGLALGQCFDLRRTLLRLTPGLVALVPLVVLRSLLGPAPFLWTGTLGPLTIHASAAGTAAATVLFWNVMGGLALVALTTATTPAPRFLEALRWYRVPEVVLETASLMYRYLFLLLEEGERLRSAHRLRSRTWQITRRARVTAVIAGSLLIRAYDRAESVAQAQSLRLGERRTHEVTLASPRWDHMGAALTALVLMGTTVRP